MGRFGKNRLFAFICICAAAVSVLPIHSAFAQKSVGIAAIVNNDLITSSDVEARFNMAVKGANMKPNAEEAKALRRQALDALIDEQIRLQEAKRESALPDDKEVDEAFSRMASQNRMTADQFKKMLTQTPGVYESLLRQLKTQAAWGNVVRKKIRPQINITEDDINAYLAEKERNPAKVEYQVAEIFLKNTDENMQVARRIVSDLRAGKQRFAVVARQFSQGLEASKGGLLGWIEEKRLEPVLDKAISSTPAGKITDVIASQRGLHIFLVREKRDILPASLASQRLNVKQIALQLPANIPDNVHKQAQEHMEFLRRESKNCNAMDEVIKKVNSPLASDLGEVRLSDLPPLARQNVKDLDIGKISKTIRSNEGYVIYMVCGRNEVTDNTIRDDVADIIGTERLNRLQFRHYRDLRSGAFIDIKEQ